MIRISAYTADRTVTIRAIDGAIRCSRGAYWLSSPMGPVEGYPARIPSANRVRIVGSVTPQANALRALSSPTLAMLSQNEVRAGYNVRIERTDGRGCDYSTVATLSNTRTIVFPRGQSIGIAAEDSHCLNNVRDAIRDDILSDCFIRSYIETALWSSTMMPENDDVSDLSYERANFDASDCSLETVIGAKRDCDGFRFDNDADLDASGDDDGRNGHNFWLSRNGHGAGFFDRCDDVGTRLQDAARVYGEVTLYHVGESIVSSDADVDTIGAFVLDTVWS